jgi:hypothetical protein
VRASAQVVGLETPAGRVVEFPREVYWDKTLFWLDEQDGVLLLIPRIGDNVLRVDLATGTVEHLERLYRVAVKEFLVVKMWPDPDGTAVLRYERGDIRLDASARVRRHEVFNDVSDTVRRWSPAELPALGGPPAAKRTIGVKGTPARPSTSIVIELVTFSLLDEALLYGLLGATFTWTPGDSLTVTVLADGGQPLVDNLAYAPRRPEGKATFGLPEECVGSVVRGFGAGAGQVADLPGGLLVFNYAACGNVGPSTRVFHGLAAAITRQLLGPPAPWCITVCDVFSLPGPN